MADNKNVFNPVKEETDGVRARRVIWSTVALDAALKGLDSGRKLVANPFYENNPRLLKSDLVFKHTEEEKKEWRKCCNDIIYFANTYCKLTEKKFGQTWTMATASLQAPDGAVWTGHGWTSLLCFLLDKLANVSLWIQE